MGIFDRKKNRDKENNAPNIVNSSVGDFIEGIRNSRSSDPVTEDEIPKVKKKSDWKEDLFEKFNPGSILLIVLYILLFIFFVIKISREMR